MQADFYSPRVLGRSGLVVGRLGLASSYGAPSSAYERAFEHGCNYFYWGTLRRRGMGDAIRQLAKQHRQQMVVVLQSYSRTGGLLRFTIESGLRRLALDHADILLLGWHNRPPSNRLMDAALRLQARGTIRHIAISGHIRSVFPQLVTDARIATVMFRYNPAHRGAETQIFPHLQADRPGTVSYTATRWGTMLNRRYTPAGLRTPTALDCYRFALSHPAVDVCLTGPATASQMRDNLRTLELGPMSDDDLAWIRQVGDNVYRLTAHKRTNPLMQREM